MKARMMAIAAVLSLLIAGCASSKTDGLPRMEPIPVPSVSSPRPLSTTTPMPPSYSQVTQGVFSIPSQGSCTVEGDLGGFAQHEMLDYVACLLPGLAQWQSVVAPGTPYPTQYVFISKDARPGYSPSGCWYDSTVLLYCPTDYSVYVGDSAAWMQYDVFGDAALALILGHELTHHFQQLSGVGLGNTAEERRAREDQADCGGGVFMAYAKEQGGMAKDDINDLVGSLDAAGEAEGPHSKHGTDEERLAAFEKGYNSIAANKLAACNEFVPEVPLIRE